MLIFLKKQEQPTTTNFHCLLLLWLVVTWIGTSKRQAGRQALWQNDWQLTARSNTAWLLAIRILMDFGIACYQNRLVQRKNISSSSQAECRGHAKSHLNEWVIKFLQVRVHFSFALTFFLFSFENNLNLIHSKKTH